MLDVGLFIAIVYFCLALYAIYLSAIVYWKKIPYITDQKRIRTLFLCILTLMGYFLLIQHQWIGVVIVYLLFIVDLFLLWIVVPAEFRVFCSKENPLPYISKVLFVLNIPFEQKKDRFLFLQKKQSLTVKKSSFHTYRIIMEPGQDKTLLKMIQKETIKIIRHENLPIYKKGVYSLAIFGVLFLLFSLFLLFIALFHFSFSFFM
jgi:hypothetical protein